MNIKINFLAYRSVHKVRQLALTLVVLSLGQVVYAAEGDKSKMRQVVVARRTNVVARESANSNAPIRFHLEDGRTHIAIEQSGSWLKLVGNAWVVTDEVIDAADATTLYSDLLRTDATAFAYCGRGSLYYQNGLYREAISDFDHAIEIEPNCARAYYMRGGARLQLKEINAARADLDKAIAIDPSCDLAFIFRASLALTEQDYTVAAREFDLAVEKGPFFPRHYLNRANTRMYKGPQHLALTDIEAARALDEMEPLVYLTRARYWDRMEQHEKALDDYLTTLDLDVTNSAAANGAASILYAARRFEEAMALCDAALLKQPNDIKLVVTRAFVQAALGDYKKALAAFEAIEKKDPNGVEHQVGIASIRASCPIKDLRDGKLAYAAAHLACVRSNWRNPGALACLAAACAELGDFDSALTYQQSCINLLPVGLQRRTFSEQRLEQYRRKEPLRQTILGWRS